MDTRFLLRVERSLMVSAGPASLVGGVVKDAAGPPPVLLGVPPTEPGVEKYFILPFLPTMPRVALGGAGRAPLMAAMYNKANQRLGGQNVLHLALVALVADDARHGLGRKPRYAFGCRFTHMLEVDAAFQCWRLQQSMNKQGHGAGVKSTMSFSSAVGTTAQKALQRRRHCRTAGQRVSQTAAPKHEQAQVAATVQATLQDRRSTWPICNQCSGTAGAHNALLQGGATSSESPEATHMTARRCRRWSR